MPACCCWLAHIVFISIFHPWFLCKYCGWVDYVVELFRYFSIFDVFGNGYDFVVRPSKIDLLPNHHGRGQKATSVTLLRLAVAQPVENWALFELATMSSGGVLLPWGSQRNFRVTTSGFLVSQRTQHDVINANNFLNSITTKNLSAVICPLTYFVTKMAWIGGVHIEAHVTLNVIEILSECYRITTCSCVSMILLLFHDYTFIMMRLL